MLGVLSLSRARAKINQNQNVIAERRANGNSCACAKSAGLCIDVSGPASILRFPPRGAADSRNNVTYTTVEAPLVDGSKEEAGSQQFVLLI